MRFGRGLFVAAGVVVGFLAGLAACEGTLREDRVATCRRALPALAQGPGVAFQSAGAGQSPDTVRVDYTQGLRPHRLTCRFDATGLIEVAADGRTLSGSALHLLRRYYLETPDAASADPAGR